MKKFEDIAPQSIIDEYDDSYRTWLRENALPDTEATAKEYIMHEIVYWLENRKWAHLGYDKLIEVFEYMNGKS